LKENVIIGKLIPAGTGFVQGRFTEQERIEQVDYAPPTILDTDPSLDTEPTAAD
jgi:hypothetical protein